MSKQMSKRAHRIATGNARPHEVTQGALVALQLRSAANDMAIALVHHGNPQLAQRYKAACSAAADRCQNAAEDEDIGDIEVLKGLHLEIEEAFEEGEGHTQ